MSKTITKVKDSCFPFFITLILLSATEPRIELIVISLILPFSNLILSVFKKSMEQSMAPHWNNMDANCSIVDN